MDRSGAPSNCTRLHVTPPFVVQRAVACPSPTAVPIPTRDFEKATEFKVSLVPLANMSQFKPPSVERNTVPPSPTATAVIESTNETERSHGRNGTNERVQARPAFELRSITLCCTVLWGTSESSFPTMRPIPPGEKAIPECQKVSPRTSGKERSVQVVPPSFVRTRAPFSPTATAVSLFR